MKKTAILVIGIMILIGLHIYFKITPDSPYEKYRDWFDKEISSEINNNLISINKK